MRYRPLETGAGLSSWRGATLPCASTAAALISLGFFIALILQATGGVFEYPLDDPYIHLTMADSIARGEYGINAGEASSAASSTLFPLLLLPVLPADLQRLLPLFWNAVGLAAAAWLWGLILAEAGFAEPGRRHYGLALAVLGPVAVNLPGIAALGMEHALQAAAVLGMFYGLQRHLNGRPVWGLYFAAVAAGTALRYEPLGFALMTALALALTGERARAGLAALVAILPPLLFAGFLLSQGLDPMPNSVQAKAAIVQPDVEWFVARVALFIYTMSARESWLLLFCALFLVVPAFRALSPRRRRSLDLLALTALTAIIGHLLLSRPTSSSRYVNYVTVIAVAALAMGFVQARGVAEARWTGFALAASVTFGLAIDLPRKIADTAASARAVWLQQYQMKRLATDFVAAPVAVNDIGHVAWRNPNYVLDLWGLASSEALETRLGNPDPGWAGPLAEARGVELAMIYDDWLGDAVGRDWEMLGRLRIDGSKGFVDHGETTFYATRPDAVAPLVNAIRAWREDLPAGASFAFAEGIE